MSRGLRLIPIILLLWLVVGLAWRLVKPADTAIPSQMVDRPVPPFVLPSAISGKTSSERDAASQAIWPGKASTSGTTSAVPRAAAVPQTPLPQAIRTQAGLP